MSGLTGSPACPAEYRDERNAVSTPSPIHSVRLSGKPLSNTDESSPEVCAITNGAQPSPGAAGSLASVTGSADSRSPIRVPPPGLLNTVRPSAAPLAPADQYR